ncbi:hypothetical protein F5Y14DRAFT_407099 [Nemania sp. NC0429]|nr:hypothetical protein F5Y14DRAFT_407099 [Nemania sp. NC0429]
MTCIVPLSSLRLRKLFILSAHCSAVWRTNLIAQPLCRVNFMAMLEMIENRPMAISAHIYRFQGLNRRVGSYHFSLDRQVSINCEAMDITPRYHAN